jgi:hypothetical protein
MGKLIFIMGCSFSHHDVYVNADETWPSLLQEELNCTIINGSIPGNSNLGYFYRLKEMEQKFGTPDKVVIQLTGPHRLFFHQKKLPVCEIVKIDNRDYYYDAYTTTYKEAGTNITPSVTSDKRRLARLHEHYGIKKQDIITYWRYFGTDDSLEWLITKEIMLINLYFKNTIFFSWYVNFQFLNLYKNYIGNLKQDIIPEDKWNSYSHIPTIDEHFNAIGHQAVKEIIKQYV